ncbi:uncharacterized protein LOC119098842 [Pollicipes pollicipes]|uniref:uncharacterized protein LOC119098842 n=1 Tax=Pollicipes pollicipes TaxID=41117 RepID=UPI0018858383|nr:uncharacterized protein LOC119098842 [Pollicipes pollicipes]
MEKSMASEAAYDRQWRLRAAFFGDDEAEFTRLLRQDGVDLNFVYGEPAFEPLLLSACRRHDWKRVRRLRELGADLEARDLSGDRTALLWAAEQAELPLLQLLLGDPAAGDAAAEETSFIAPPVDLNARNTADSTALMRPPTERLDLTPLRDDGPRGLDETALHKAARCEPAPGVRQDFDECLRLLLAERADTPCACPQIDFTCLVPPQRPQKTPEMPVLMRMRDSPLLRPLLRHPVIVALLYLKYDRVRWIYYFNVLLFLSFTVLLTLFVFGLDGRAGLGEWASSAGVRIVLTVGLALLALRELVQVTLSGPLYFLSLENLVEMGVVALGLPLLWATLSSATAHHLSAWVMIFTWLEVAMSMGRLPSLARYKTMMESIALSFGKLIFLYFGLVLAFAIAFYLVFNGVDSFATFGVSVPKAIAMATGEFDYGDLSATLQVDAAQGIGPSHVVSSVLLFICFLFLIFIVLMNLLTALAVDDTKAIMDNAEVMAQDNRTLLLSYIEDFFLLTYLPRRLKRPDGALREAADSCCSGLRHRLRSRLLLFHSALSACTYPFFPNRRPDEVTCRVVANAMRQRQCGHGARLCLRWLTLDECAAGDRRRELCELPAEVRQQLLKLVVKEPTLQQQVDKLQSDVTVLASALFAYLEAQKSSP